MPTGIHTVLAEHKYKPGWLELSGCRVPTSKHHWDLLVPVETHPTSSIHILDQSEVPHVVDRSSSPGYSHDTRAQTSHWVYDMLHDCGRSRHCSCPELLPPYSQPQHQRIYSVAVAQVLDYCAVRQSRERMKVVMAHKSLLEYIACCGAKPMLCWNLEWQGLAVELCQMRCLGWDEPRGSDVMLELWARCCYHLERHESVQWHTFGWSLIQKE